MFSPAQQLSSGHYACPTCQTSMMDMNQLWEFLDAEVAATPMPKEYENYFVDILCKDCHKVRRALQHCTHIPVFLGVNVLVAVIVSRNRR